MNNEDSIINADNSIIVKTGLAAKFIKMSVVRKMIAAVLALVLITGVPVVAVFISKSVKEAAATADGATIHDTANDESVSNNGGSFVKYKGNIYYREYTAEDIESSSVADKYGNVTYPYKGRTEKNMVCLYSDGTKKVMFEDTGSGKIFIYGERFYLTEPVNSDKGEPDIIYSVDINGENRTELGKGSILDLSVDKGILICGNDIEHSQLFTVMISTGANKVISDFEKFFTLYDNRIYFSENVTGQNLAIKLSSAGLDGVKTTLVERKVPYIDESEYGTGVSAVSNIQIVDDYVYLIYGVYDGGLMYWQGGDIARVKKDGTGFELLVGTQKEWGDNNEIREKFYVENTNNGDKLYYNNCNYEKKDNYNSDCLSLADWSEAKSSKTCEFLNTAFMKDMGISMYTDNTGKETRLINHEDYKDCGLGSELIYWKESILYIKDVEIIDGWVYYTLESGVHDPSTDISSHPLYNRTATKIFRKNLGSGKIEMLLSY